MFEYRNFSHFLRFFFQWLLKLIGLKSNTQRNYSFYLSAQNQRITIKIK